MSSNVVLISNPEQTSIISWDERLHRAMDRYTHIKGAKPALRAALERIIISVIPAGKSAAATVYWPPASM